MEEELNWRMKYSQLKLWFILTFTFAVVAVVIRAIWQIVKSQNKPQFKV